MRISESRIRRIIREEVEQAVDEMAYAGDLGVRYSPDQEEESFFSAEVVGAPNRAGAEKFARSGRFATLAKKYFENIPFNVWVAPLIGVGAEVYDSIDSTRVRLTPLVPDGVEKLEEFGFESPARVGADDTVILYTAMSTGKDSMATPWMLIHAMFDSGDSMRAVCPSYYDLVMNLTFGDPDELDPVFEPLVGDEISRSNMWTDALTMKSARDRLIGVGPNDAFAEIMCQELLTKGGVRFDYDRVRPETAEALRALVPVVKRGADEFRSRIRGKLVTVAVN